MRLLPSFLVLAMLTAFAVPGSAAQAPNSGQSAGKPAAQPSPRASSAPANQKAVPDPSGVPAGVTPPPGYVIGPDDVLMVLHWREKDMSAEVSVRPDGMITLPLLNEVQAAGLSPEQLRQQIEKRSAEFIEEPSVTIVVKQINSRRVFVTGNVAKAGMYPLTTGMTVLQAIAAAGGLNEYADEKGISVMRVEGGKTQRLKFNYKDVTRGKKLEQNVALHPGDTIVVP
jgi:polysaccharide export outer membrane protein